MYREARRPAAEVDLVGQHSSVGIDVPFGPLIADLSAHHPDVRDGDTDSAEDHGADAVAVGGVLVAEDEIVGIDELAGLAVAPVEEPDAAADVRLHAAA